ncbi:MAG: LysR family transcriptional regulator [Eubacteriales bacterium]|nr:LysR family transcriptional regulator [Eubacteriales bacterium]
MNKYYTFLKAAECKSFTRAADELGYTQSAISQMIRSLEKEFHAPLFLRSRSGLELTFEGQTLMPYIRSLVDSYEAFSEKQLELTGESSKNINLGLFATFTDALLPDILLRFQQSYPDIRFFLRQGYYYLIRDSLRRDDVHLAIINTDTVDTEDYQIVPLFEDPIYLIMSKNNPLQDLDVVPISRIEHETIISLSGLDDEDYTNRLKDEGIFLNIRYHFGDDNSIVSCVKNDLGVALMPALGFLNRADEIVFRPTDPPLSRPIGVIYKKKKHLSTAEKHFLTCLQDVIREKQAAHELTPKNAPDPAGE